MARLEYRSPYWEGFRSGIPFVLVSGPFAMLFGVVATEAGLSLLQTMSFSLVVVAGAAQFAAIQQMNDGAPVLIVLAIALAVNLRMAMYSAALAPYLGGTPVWKRALAAYMLFDQNYALSAVTFEIRPEMSSADRLSYFIGATTPLVFSWYAMTLVGALVGESIPPEFALDFALPITFLSLIGPALRTPAHVAAALVSVAGALVLSFLPFNTGLLVAAVAAMMVGAQVELRLKRHMA